MHGTVRVGLFVAALMSPAVAQPSVDPVPTASPGAAPAPVVPAQVEKGHKGQVQLSLRTAIGMRAIVPYEKGEYCGDLDNETSSGNAPVCSSRAPFSIDLELGYGITPKIDTILEMRLGLEGDFGATAATTDGPSMFHLSPGARFFFSDTKRTKLFSTAQIVLDFAGYKDAGGQGKGADFGLRNMNGLWIDVKRNYSVYAYVGETLTFARWLKFELEGGLGFSYRYP
ncbi:MAG: hypothetical protein SFX73_29955 [Kofleriaceae bacterium]|nr:hypothetical protein [Kofleriaceae bacterium]